MLKPIINAGRNGVFKYMLRATFNRKNNFFARIMLSKRWSSRLWFKMLLVTGFKEIKKTSDVSTGVIEQSSLLMAAMASQPKDDPWNAGNN